ncbi:MAG: 5'-methylthioadenosine nucleosidase [Pseudomonadota bacterium]
MAGLAVGVVVGLERERRSLVRGWGHGYAPMPLLAVAMGPEAATRAAEHLLASGAEFLVAFGTAGALDPALRPGDLVVPDTVGDGDTSIRLQQDDLRARLEASGGRLLGVRTPLVEIDAKIDAAARGFAAVDMESFAVARVAGEAGVPVRVVRAIVDPARRRLPHVARVAVDDAGRLKPLAICAALTGRPREWPLVWRTARDARAAEASLRRAAATLARLAGQGLL